MNTFTGQVRKRQLFIDHRDQFDAFVAGLPDGERVQITIKQKPRSLKANAYYWAILRVAAEHTGHTPEELHEAYKAMFLQPRFIMLGDEEVAVSGSSAVLDKPGFHEYVEQVKWHIITVLECPLPDWVD